MRDLKMYRERVKNIKSTFFKFIFSVFLALDSVKAMNEEETSKFTQAKPIQQRTSPKKSLQLISHIEGTTFESLADELLVAVLRFLEPTDLGKLSSVSTRFKRVIEDPGLWGHIGLKYYGDYLSEEDRRRNPRQKVISHYLSLMVNATESLEDIEKFVRHYRLDLYVPFFKKYIETISLTELVTNSSGYDELIAQGNKEVIERKFNGHLEGEYGYKKDLVAARELNEFFVEKGDLKAIKRKIKGLLHGYFGYEKNS